MADTDILQAIRIIDEKIASLQEARNRLASAFGVSDVPLRSDFPKQSLSPKPPVAQAPAPTEHTTNGHGHPKGRKEQLAEFLAEHGPMARVAIVEKAGLPEGTVSYCLSDKRFFEQLEGGDWAITEFSRRGLDRKAKGETFKGDTSKFQTQQETH